MPKVIEFLDSQGTLIPGALYISTEKNAIEYFSRQEVLVHQETILLVSDASEAQPKFPDELTVLGFFDTLGKLYNLISEYIDAPAARNHAKRFGEIWGKIMENPALQVEEIRNMLSELPDVIGQFVQVCVVVFHPFEKYEVPYNRIMMQIKAVIPNCCATVRDREIILLVSYDSRRFDYPFPFEQISSMIEKYNGYMGISNGTRELTALRTLYYLARRIVSLALDIEVATTTRIFTFERLGTYAAIDFCACGFKALFDEKGLVYLAHPAIVAIARYDREHNDNLQDVLYFYLFHDRSITNTAGELYMHRNTVMNKIKKINNLFHLDLEDKYLRQRLLFSCQLVKYCEDMGIMEHRPS